MRALELKQGVISWVCETQLTSEGYRPGIIAASIDKNGDIKRLRSVVLRKGLIIQEILWLEKALRGN